MGTVVLAYGSIKCHLRAEMARRCASERALVVDETFELNIKSNKDDPTILTLTKKFRYWIDG